MNLYYSGVSNGRRWAKESEVQGRRRRVWTGGNRRELSVGAMLNED